MEDEVWVCTDMSNRCALCDRPATHKVEESYGSQCKHPPLSTLIEMWRQTDGNTDIPRFHPYTSYVCCSHFRALMGNAVGCVDLSPASPQ